MTTQRIAGGEAVALSVDATRSVRIINVEGSQVVDVWAFNRDDPREFLSTEHTRSCLERLTPRVGESLFTNRRRPILTLLEDSSPGVHDLLLSACDQERYNLLGHLAPHRNCADNFWRVVQPLSLDIDHIPSPFNVFENVRIDPLGGLEIKPPPVGAGESVTCRAEMDLHLIFSVCPMDIAPTNGTDGRAKPIDIELIRT